MSSSNLPGFRRHSRPAYVSLSARLGRLEQRVARLEGIGDTGEAEKALQARIQVLQEQVKKGDICIHHLKKEKQDLARRCGELQAKLDAANQAWQELRRKYDSAQEETKALRRNALPDQARLEQIQARLQNLHQDWRPLVERYYSLTALPVFLTQCGQFTRLQQCWEACHKKVMAGTDAAGLTDFLRLVLELYNYAFPDNPGGEISAKAGDEYDFARQVRIGTSGTVVASVLLPGLIMPNGQIAIKCLVRLN